MLEHVIELSILTLVTRDLEFFLNCSNAPVSMRALANTLTVGLYVGLFLEIFGLYLLDLFHKSV